MIEEKVKATINPTVKRDSRIGQRVALHLKNGEILVGILEDIITPSGSNILSIYEQFWKVGVSKEKSVTINYNSVAKVEVM